MWAKLSTVNSAHGAPMGRPSWDDTGGEEIQIKVTKLKFVDGDYDEGGAYWGSPANVYWCRSEDATRFQQFFRADNTEEAIAMVKHDFPNVTVVE